MQVLLKCYTSFTSFTRLRVIRLITRISINMRQCEVCRRAWVHNTHLPRAVISRMGTPTNESIPLAGRRCDDAMWPCLNTRRCDDAMFTVDLCKVDPIQYSMLTFISFRLVTNKHPYSKLMLQLLKPRTPQFKVEYSETRIFCTRMGVFFALRFAFPFCQHWT